MADGNIQAARKRFDAAVERLTSPRTLVHYGHVLAGPSLWEWLGSDPATGSDTRVPPSSVPPMWLDPVLLRMEITAQVGQWARQAEIRLTKRGDVPDGLNRLAARGWRPQDTKQVTGMGRVVDGWCDQITSMFDPDGRKFIEAACPSCGTRMVHRPDSAGEIVRQPALVVVANVGATCQRCGATWSPDRYLFLCRLLGFELPAGVLE